jgi:hypothetical protein
MGGVRWIVAVLVIAGLGISQLSAVSAFPAYRAQVVQQFKLTDARVGCTYCHVSVSGGAPWNPFGQAVQNKLTGDIAATLLEVLQANQDADSDGYSDALEVFAGTLPGNKDSAPLVKVVALQIAFDKSGGVAQFKP